MKKVIYLPMTTRRKDIRTQTKIHNKTCVKRPLSKRTKLGVQDHLSLNADQKYCRILKGEHSAILLTVCH